MYPLAWWVRYSRELEFGQRFARELLFRIGRHVCERRDNHGHLFNPPPESARKRPCSYDACAYRIRSDLKNWKPGRPTSSKAIWSVLPVPRMESVVMPWI